MDIAGAKALKERLGTSVTDETRPVSVDVPEGAPPVFDWLGVSRPRVADTADDEPGGENASVFHRLALAFR